MDLAQDGHQIKIQTIKSRKIRMTKTSKSQQKTNYDIRALISLRKGNLGTFLLEFQVNIDFEEIKARDVNKEESWRLKVVYE